MYKKVNLKDVIEGDDNTFWAHIRENPHYPDFVADVEYIIAQSEKHGVPFNEIDSNNLDPYNWKL